MFESCSLSSSHPLLSHLCPQAWSLCLPLSDFHFTVRSANNILTFTPVLFIPIFVSLDSPHPLGITGRQTSLWTQWGPWPCCINGKQALLLLALLWLLFLPPQHLLLPASSAPRPTPQAPRCQSCTEVCSKAGVECFYPSVCHMQTISKRGLLTPLCLSECAPKATFLHFVHTLLLWPEPQEIGWGGRFSLLENQGSMNGSPWLLCWVSSLLAGSLTPHAKRHLTSSLDIFLFYWWVHWTQAGFLMAGFVSRVGGGR